MVRRIRCAPDSETTGFVQVNAGRGGRQARLRFVTSLAGSAPRGEPGAALRQFSSSLDTISARQKTQAIEEECERADAG